MEVLDVAVRRVRALESDRTPEMSEAQRAVVAQQIGLGALAYSMLSVDNSRDLVFDMDAALSFEGHTGPYIQNAYVRANNTTLVVADAMYFQDGTWGSDLARGVTFFPDWIAIGTVTNTVQISSINYATNTITLASPMTWKT